jgi:hypothetical protein
MKKLSRLLVILPFAASAILVGCTKEKETIIREDGGNNNNVDPNSYVSYQVIVAPATSNEGVGEATSVQDAAVTVFVQGQPVTKTVGADGIAQFDSLRPGTVSGYVTKAGFTSVSYTADLSNAGNSGNAVDGTVSSGSVSSASTLVKIYPRTAKLRLRVYGYNAITETPVASEQASRRNVNAYVTYTLGDFETGSGPGRITSMTISPTVVSKTLLQTENGSVIDGLAGTEDGVLQASLGLETLMVYEDINGVDVPFVLPSDAAYSDLNLITGATLNLGDVQVLNP